MFNRDYLLETIRDIINGTTLSRVFKHTTSKERPFAMLTAFRGGQAEREENVRRNKQLAAKIRNEGYGFFYVDGYWIENEGTPEEEKVKEDSIFVVGKKDDNGRLKGLVRKWRKQYDQDAVLYREAGADSPILIFATKEEKIGKLSLSKLGDIYTRLRGRGGKKFAFASTRDDIGWFARLGKK